MRKSDKTRGRKVAHPRNAAKGGRAMRGKPTRKILPPLVNAKSGVPNVHVGDKVGGMIVMLCGDKGASIEELSKATGWQPHSVRAAISATIKKKLRLHVQSEKVGKVRRYRVINRAGS